MGGIRDNISVTFCIIDQEPSQRQLDTGTTD